MTLHAFIRFGIAGALNGSICCGAFAWLGWWGIVAGLFGGFAFLFAATRW